MADSRHMTAAHVWLFQGGCDPDQLDFNGVPLSRSLAELLAQFERTGRLSVEDTGSYNVHELNKLLAATKDSL